jgi:hypothetical protein
VHLSARIGAPPAAAPTLAAANGAQKNAAALIGMPLRTFTMKYRQCGLGDPDAR